ncbi:MAG: hypothetical protein WAS26_17595 [Paracoccaceae bacterium]
MCRVWSWYPVILEPLYLYCERTGPGLLGEPVNFLASFAFVLVARSIWRMAEASGLLRLMAGLTFLLCPGGLYLHSLPSAAALAANLVAILALILVYFYGLNRHVVGLAPAMAVVCALLILPFAAVSLPLIGLIRGAASSAAYLALPILLLGYSAALRPEMPATARGLLVAALIMLSAIILRSIDLPLCGVWPWGTHFLWIMGAALLLWQLAHVYRQHGAVGQGGLAGPGGGR